MRIAKVVIVSVLVLGAAACSDDDEGDDDASSSDAESSSETAEPLVIEADLTGAAEVPGPGAEDASGTAEITVTPGTEEVCYSLTVTGLEGVTAAHIHEGRADIAGGIAVTLDAPVEGSSEGCVSASSSIVTGLTDGSRAFYVNVHTEEFGDGAVRGQLTE